MVVVRGDVKAGAVRMSSFTSMVSRQMARDACMATCEHICQPYSAQPGTPCGCKCMMYCAGK